MSILKDHDQSLYRRDIPNFKGIKTKLMEHIDISERKFDVSKKEIP